MDAISNRTISALPLSIGTSLAFESVFDPQLAPYDPAREIPVRVDLTQYNAIWINIATLIRNIIAALPKESQASVTAVDIKDAVFYETDMLAQLATNKSPGCKCVFYLNNYTGLFGNVTLAAYIKIRTPNTALQIAYDRLIRDVLKVIKKDRHIDVIEFTKDLKPSAEDNKALIFTHVPYDLVSYSAFNKLHLIESHTGKLKTRKEWSSKYYAMVGTSMVILPFTRKLLMIFGDHVMFKPLDIRFRRLILDTAVKRKWTPLTTESKIRADLDLDVRERFLLEVYDKI